MKQRDMQQLIGSAFLVLGCAMTWGGAAMTAAVGLAFLFDLLLTELRK